MENTQLSNHIEETEAKESISHDEYAIGSRAFHHLNRIGKEMQFMRRLNFAFMILLLIASGAIAYFIYGHKKMNDASRGSGRNPATAIIDTVEMLKSDNKMLREKNAALEEQIRLIRKQFQMRGDLSENESSNGGSELSVTDRYFFHEVNKGETLYTLAERYYGDKRMYRKILNDNNLSGEADIVEGKKLKIQRLK